MYKICLLAIILIMLFSCSESDKFYESDRNSEIEYVDFFWIIDGNIERSEELKEPKLDYGKHNIKLVLVDFYGDTITYYSKDTCVNEPIKITLLSPIDKYEMPPGVEPVYEYKISGSSCIEYTDKVFIDEVQDEDAIHWKVGVIFAEQETVFSNTRTLLWEKD